jgi:hypothetical protein
VELDLRDLAQTLLARGGALTVSELREELDAYLNELLKHHDPALVRIKIILADTEEIA